MGFGRYLRAAFSARPFGMPIPPNWIGLAAFGLLGLIHPGFWLVGAGVELLYLWALVANPRFQATVDAVGVRAEAADLDRRKAAITARLDGPDRRAQDAIEGRCLEAMRLHRERAGDGDPAVEAQAEALSRLAWVHLRLLDARHGLIRLLGDGDGIPALESQVAALHGRRDQADGDDLRASLDAQIQLVESRLAGRRDADRRLAYVEAEIERLRQQAELAREEALAAPGTAVAARSVDALGEAVRSAQAWVAEQARSGGVVDDIAGEAPPLAAKRTAN